MRFGAHLILFLEDCVHIVYKGSVKQTWEEIQKQYPDEHVVIASPVTSPETPAVVEAGEVIDHDRDKMSLLERCDLTRYDTYALEYTGDLGELIGERGMIRVVEYD
jgi:hypothetical protein